MIRADLFFDAHGVDDDVALDQHVVEVEPDSGRNAIGSLKSSHVGPGEETSSRPPASAIRSIAALQPVALKSPARIAVSPMAARSGASLSIWSG